MVKQIDKKMISTVLTILALLCLAGIVYSASSGKVIHRQIFAVPAVVNTKLTTIQSDVIKLSDVGKIHNIGVTMRSIPNASFRFDIIIVRAARDTLFSFEGSLWDEKGYDSEGQWHESEKNVDVSFFLNKAGEYTFMIAPVEVQGQVQTVELTLKSGLIPKGFFVAGLFVFISFLVFVNLKYKQ